MAKVVSLADLKKIAFTNSLRGCQLFTGLALEDLDAIANFTTVKALERGDYPFHEGDQAHGF